MPVTAFEGPAGTGKTHNLIAHVASEASRRPLSSHERVLALTFMHGSRRRLDARLRDIRALVGRCRAATVDSFARRLCGRWRSLVGDLGHGVPADDDHDGTCRVAAALLARPIVQSWVVGSYPFVVVDEAQDLSVERFEMVREAAKGCHVLVAFDEFQCLNPAMRPMPIAGWLLMHPLICRYQITPKISLNTRCSASMLPNFSIKGRLRSSGQLGRW